MPTHAQSKILIWIAGDRQVQFRNEELVGAIRESEGLWAEPVSALYKPRPVQ